MNPEELPAQIFDLLQEKPFHTLKEKEKALVLRWMTAEGYQEMQEKIGVFIELDQTMEDQFIPRPLPRQLHPRPISRILHYPVPAYQVAALVLLLIGVFYYSASRQLPTEPEDRVQVKGKSIDEDQYPDSLVFNL